MIKARKKFVLYAMISIFVLLTVLLTVINVSNFEMAGKDADDITGMLSRGMGQFGDSQFGAAPEPQNDSFRMRGPMGPDSPEMANSLRYFTFAFDKDGNSETIEFRLSALTVDEARELAQSLIGKDRGWVNMTYRFRVWNQGGKTYVTVIDQGRELLASYRILTFSIVGEVVGLLISFAFLFFVGKRLFSPLEIADAKQKNFISEAESEFKVPLTVIGADLEILEKENGPNEQTASVRRQVKKMTELVKKLGSLAIFEKAADGGEVAVSDVLSAEIDGAKEEFGRRGIDLSSSVQGGVKLSGDEGAIRRMIKELIDNSLKFSIDRASFSLSESGGRIKFVQSNGTTLADGGVNEVFDRFTTLENAKDKGGHGLGLAYVKDIVHAHNGRCRAYISSGTFVLEITM